MNWTTLTGVKTVAGSIANWLNNSTITSGPGGVADVIVQESTLLIYQRLRHWRMLTSPISGTLTGGPTNYTVDYIAVPSDMIEPFMFTLTGTNQQILTEKPYEDIVRYWQFDGSGNRVPQQPLIYSFNDTNIVFDSPPDQPYPYALMYYQYPPPLSGTNNTNFLTNVYPRLLRASLMLQATEWAKDSGVGTFDRTYWSQVFEAELVNAQTDASHARRATGAGAVFVGGGIPDAPPFAW